MKFIFLFLIFSLSAVAADEICLEKLIEKYQSPKAVNPTKELLPPLAQRLIDETKDRIRNVKFDTSPEYNEEIIKIIGNGKLRTAFREAITKLQDKDYLAGYFMKLQRETFEVMAKSYNPRDLDLLERGILSKKALIQVLKNRAKRNDVKVVTLKKSLSRQQFNNEIGKGYLIDFGFTEKSSHGVYTHFIQQDLTYDIISKVSGFPHSKIVNFFGTAQGMDVWDKMFDAFLRNSRTPMSPEFFKPILMKPNLPIGYILVPKGNNIIS